ncbi:helix-turn-helix domain-containing protein [Aquisalibacillus elongatus]|uniref:Helix-turn-helix protein n=1 Tax=Aquisalibacillus elongatus TaxID=485577 RepID=A0A3N5BEP8_9BACI|nr:helix-turn-helix domain-containing protein [Aquisalibacillus elongatus]RPF55927.1 helix-turn-helix protein [Aquisalibacillus elongatus]
MELGERLKEARLDQELTLEDIQKETKIQKRYLEALERNDWSTLPGTFYARAFVREYAEAVNLNPDTILEEHAEELPSSESRQYEYVTPSRSKRESSGSNPVFKALPKLLTIILLIAIAFAIYYAILNFMDTRGSDGEDEQNNDEIITAPDENENDEEDANQEEESENPDESEEETEPEEEPEPDPTLEVKSVDESNSLTVYQTSNMDELVLEFSSDGNSWLGVIGLGEDGGENQYFSDSVTTKNSPVEEAIEEDRVRLRVGNAPQLDISVNGVPLEYELTPDAQQGENIVQNIIIQLNRE